MTLIGKNVKVGGKTGKVVVGEAVLAASRSLDGLNYALNVVRGRRVLRRTPDYLAAVDEMEVFLLAAIERVQNGEPMSALATVQ